MSFETDMKAEMLKCGITQERLEGITLLDSVDSTNTYLKNLVAEGEALDAHCVIADFQSGGRGRLGRSFSSPRGKGIYLSYCMSSQGIPAESIAQITAYTAVAVREAISDICGLETGIKWVNDIVYGGKKLCGILTETSNGEKPSVIIGIGVNLNHEAEDFPGELSDVAASLRMVTGNEYSRARLCSAIINKLDSLCEGLPDNKEYYLSEYRKSCVVIGKRIRIIKDEKERLGTAVGISDDFGLEARFDDGKCETLTAGEVSVRGFYGYI